MSTLAGASITVSQISQPGEKPGPRPAHHLNDSKNSFHNPWPSYRRAPDFRDVLTFAISSRPSVPGDVEEQVTAQPPNFGRGAKPEGIKATWLGHACFLVELPTPPGASRGPRILFDPVWSHRCSPSQILGPARYTKAPCKIEEIPDIDIIVISHNHYDHLDTHTITTLHRLQAPQIFAPLNNDSYFDSVCIPKTHYHCLDWWENRLITLQLPGAGSETVTAKFVLTSTPCQHFTGRGLFDRYKTLWSSWAVEEVLPSDQKGVKVWFGGDTGYRSVADGEDEDSVPHCPAFKEIGDKFGGFDLALIPIGAYLPRSLMSPIHCAPQDSVRLFKDIRAKRALGMHWGTWILTTEPVLDPPKRLAEECKKIGIADGLFTACGLGETVIVQ